MPVITRSPLLSSALALLAAMGLGTAARADDLSAAAADAALSGGAPARDVRGSADAGALPGARRIDAQALQAWLQQRDLAVLQDAVSRAGLDLSRDLVVYGEAGDPVAQALVDSLQGLSRARVHWLVGGAREWTMTGRALRPLAVGHAPVPQHLVLQAREGSGRMAAAALRGEGSPTQLAAR
jgi:3-mercaptopyruvate sulfurtransferase SseA